MQHRPPPGGFGVLHALGDSGFGVSHMPKVQHRLPQEGSGCSMPCGVQVLGGVPGAAQTPITRFRVLHALDASLFGVPHPWVLHLLGCPPLPSPRAPPGMTCQVCSSYLVEEVLCGQGASGIGVPPALSDSGVGVPHSLSDSDIGVPQALGVSQTPPTRLGVPHALDSSGIGVPPALSDSGIGVFMPWMQHRPPRWVQVILCPGDFRYLGSPYPE